MRCAARGRRRFFLATAIQRLQSESFAGPACLVEQGYQLIKHNRFDEVLMEACIPGPLAIGFVAVAAECDQAEFVRCTLRS